ncbi:response regulator, partial [Phenylobacterium sp.]|uniref:response regulator n=1 Tax=Phenylobacterium sp. TaxID=1871053 RepID=UPI002E35CD42
NQHARVLVTEILRSLDVHHVFEAADGSTGLQQLREHQIDIIFTDLSMQPMDGIEFVRRLRNAPDSPNQMAPVIMVTGHFTLAKVAEARDAGVNEFLSKPLTARGVIERLQRVIEQPRPFVRTDSYFGPDRRRRQDPEYRGPKRRKSDAVARRAPTQEI